MGSSTIIVHDGDDQHRLTITHRDAGLLHGPMFDAGVWFLAAYGVYENFTVAGGIPKGSMVKRRGRTLCNAAKTLLDAVQRDEDLLAYNYAYGFKDDPTRHGGAQGITVRGRGGILSVRPSGFCWIKLFDGRSQRSRVAEFIDLRIVERVDLDDGFVKVFRRKAEVCWPQALPPLIGFLESRADKELVVEHAGAAG